MSCNGNPEWTKDKVMPALDECKCPTCSHLPEGADEIFDILLFPSYYEARHIPPHLIFTCDNPECANVDDDYYVVLSMTVTAKATTVLPLDKDAKG